MPVGLLRTPSRRRVLALSLGAGALLSWAGRAAALTAERASGVALVSLEPRQSDNFRAWMCFIIADQIRKGPSPRWFHRDCAGLVRYAVSEAFRTHDARWRQANGMNGRSLPPEIGLRPDQAPLAAGWTGFDGSRQAYVGALGLVQNNSRLLGRDIAMARAGDLIFFDQGDDQHLMVWMGTWIAYHTGQTPVVAAAPTSKKVDKPSSKPKNDVFTTEDNGLRGVTLAELLQWKDTRWRPREDNPNFAGFYRLAFLSR